eukprot:CAMPEP_0174840682 /NCGR_PEP_ID=MMETSP1114-20130205/8836_1 /TAXON_ID=312471 /ORGANISM="Neobodo designis, Strain CCAP 1951/1" /LENGTH=313 /DNA_ID=CAMNT_0016074841 /DNA_START=33 /DNA_END=971 /DNA_ORIENTATION=+
MRGGTPTNRAVRANKCVMASVALNVILSLTLVLSWRQVGSSVGPPLHNSQQPVPPVAGCSLSCPKDPCCVPDWLGGAGMLAAQRAIPLPSDKLSVPHGLHAYEGLYEKYLGFFKHTCGKRGTPVKLLEIGIGPDGAARSMSLYEQFLPNLRYHALEYEDQRALLNQSAHLSRKQKQWLLDHLVIGDQSRDADLAKLQQWAPYDVIVDDGGHMTWQQTKTLDVLFLHALAPGGTYIIEDLQTSFHQNWSGGKDWQKRRDTTVAVLQDLLAGLHYHWWNDPRYNSGLRENVYGQEMHLPGFQLHSSLLLWIESIE